MGFECNIGNGVEDDGGGEGGGGGGLMRNFACSSSILCWVWRIERRRIFRSALISALLNFDRMTAHTPEVWWNGEKNSPVER